jgi:hypothetical protein
MATRENLADSHELHALSTSTHNSGTRTRNGRRADTNRPPRAPVT